jgi:hypothetical protein
LAKKFPFRRLNQNFISLAKKFPFIQSFWTEFHHFNLKVSISSFWTKNPILSFCREANPTTYEFTTTAPAM